jgi:uncharacterized protein (DUF4415 family)
MKKEYDLNKARPLRTLHLPPLDEIDRPTKVRISLYLDNDLLKWFKGRAQKPGSDTYQTLINKALRAYMEETQKEGPSIKDELLQDEEFLSRLAKKLKRVG